MGEAKKILKKYVDLPKFTNQHKKLEFWILLAMEEYKQQPAKCNCERCTGLPSADDFYKD